MGRVRGAGCGGHLQLPASRSTHGGRRHQKVLALLKVSENEARGRLCGIIATTNRDPADDVIERVRLSKANAVAGTSARWTGRRRGCW